MEDTAAQLVTEAARMARVASQETPVAAYIQSQGITILNDILDELGGGHITIPNQTVVVFDTVAGQTEYTNGIGSGYDINGPQIIGVLQMYSMLNGVRSILNQMNEKSNANITYPANQSWPSNFLMRYASNSESTSFFLYPTPSQEYQITIIAKQRLANVSANTELSSLPRHWKLALKKIISYYYRTYNGMPITQEIQEGFADGKRVLRSLNTFDLSPVKTETLRGGWYTPWYPIGPSS